MFDWLKCLLGDHDWTCDAEENIDPPALPKHYTGDDLAAFFFRYARTWCKRCRCYMKPSPRLRGSEHWDASVTHHS